MAAEWEEESGGCSHIPACSDSADQSCRRRTFAKFHFPQRRLLLYYGHHLAATAHISTVKTRDFAKASCSLLTLLCRLCWVPGYAVTVKEMPFSPRHCPQSPAWMPADAEHVDRSPKIRCLPVGDNQIQHQREKSLSIFTFIYKEKNSFPTL